MSLLLSLLSVPVHFLKQLNIQVIARSGTIAATANFV